MFPPLPSSPLPTVFLGPNLPHAYLSGDIVEVSQREERESARYHLTRVDV